MYVIVEDDEGREILSMNVGMAGDANEALQIATRILAEPMAQDD